MQTGNIICSHLVSLLDGSALYLIFLVFIRSQESSPTPYEISNYHRKIHNLLLRRGIHGKYRSLLNAAMGFASVLQ